MDFPKPRTIDERIASLVPDIDEVFTAELEGALRTLRDGQSIPGAIIQAARITEGNRGILGRIAAANQLTLKGGTLDSQINELAQKGIIPAEIASDLHWLRVRSNKARHNIEKATLTEDDAETAISRVLRVMEWFYCESNFGGKLETIYEQGSCEPITIKGEIQKLRRDLVCESKDAEVTAEPIVGLCPADVSDFFKDREDKVTEIHHLLGNKSVKFICIVGRGGMGKTALLSKICAEIERGEFRIEGTTRAMGASGIIYVSCRASDAPTVELLFDDIARMLGSPSYEEIMECWRDASKSIAEKTRYLLSKLRDGAYLLILDNLEDILDADNNLIDENLATFLQICFETPHALRLLATSREKLIVDGISIRATRTVPLDSGLPDDDAVTLLRDLDPTGELGLKEASGELLLQAARACYGIPRALETVAGILSSDPTVTLEALLGDNELFNEQVVENLIAEHYRRVDREQQSVLEALAIYNKPVPAAAVVFLANAFFPDIDVDRCIKDLVRHYFVTFRREQNTFELHPLDQNHAYDHIPESDGEYSRMNCHKRAAEFWLEQADKARQGDSLDSFDQWEMEKKQKWVLSIGWAIDQLMRAEAWENILAVPTHRYYQENFLWGYTQECENTCRALLRAAVLSGNKEKEAHWLHEFAVLNTHLCRHEEAEKNCLDAIELAKQTGQEELQAHLLHRMGLILSERGKHEEAKNYFRQSAALKEQVKGKEWAATALCECAVLTGDEGNLQQALAILTESAEIVREEDYDAGVKIRARCYRANVLRKLGEYEPALLVLDEIESMARDYGYLKRLGIIVYEKGMVSYCRGENEKASDLFEESYELIRTLGFVRETARCMCGLGRAYHQRGLLDDAKECYLKGLNANTPGIGYVPATFLGAVFLETNEKEEATKMFQEGISLTGSLLKESPNIYDPVYFKAFCYLGLGGQAKALDILGEATEICCGRGVVDEKLHDLALLGRVRTFAVQATQAQQALESMANRLE